MPVKNGANYFAEAWCAIKAQNVAVEIIVVDDGSTDDTAQIAENFGCVVLKHEVSKGSVIAKNTALKIARGKFVMFHDHDDVMNQHALTQLLKEFEENSEVAAVMAQMRDFFSPEISDATRAKIALRAEPYFGVFSGAVLMKREVFDVIGMFSKTIQAGDIIDWKSKMDQHNLVIKKVDLVAANRRIHNCNFGRVNKQTEFKDYAAILRSKLKK